MAIGGQFTGAWQHGTQGAATTLTDFTAKTRAVTASFNRESVDATVFGDTHKDYELSFADATIEVTYKVDATIYGQIMSIFSNGTTVSFQHSPLGTGTGAPRDTGSAFITSVTPPQSVGALIEMTVSFQVTDAVTFGSHT